MSVTADESILLGAGCGTTLTRWNPGAGPVVCLLHPLAVDRRAFRALVACLPPDHEYVAFDQRGHGASDCAPETITLDAMAGDVVRVLDTLGTGRAHLVGHSLGGAVAALAAARWGDRFCSLALVATPDAGYPVFAQRAAEAERVGMAGVEQATLERWFAPPFRGEDHPGYVYARNCLRAVPVAHWAAAWRTFAAFPGYAELGPRLPPTLCIAGALDQSTPPAVMARIAAAANAPLQVVTGAAHFMTLERPADTAALLRPHWDRHRP